MTMQALLADHPIVPVIVIEDAGAAKDLAGALADGGIRCAEITLRTRAARDAIAAIADIPGFSVGAGTVLSVDDLEAVVGLGAKFIVSPGFDDALVERAAALGVG